MAESSKDSVVPSNLLPEGAEPVVNRYTNLGRYTSPSYVVRGTVLAAFQGLQFYDVSTDYGRFVAMYAGATRGRLGAREGGGFLPGDQVWIAVSPQLPGTNAFIIGGCTYASAGAPQTSRPLLVYPQVAGFEIQHDGSSDSGNGKRLSGKLYTELSKLRNFNTGLNDTVDGDWVMHNMFGGALGVEAFRVFMQGGPMSGVYCYTEDNHTRVVGSRYELITMAEEYEDRQLGTGLVSTSRRVYYPMDAAFENAPQVIKVEGPQYGGKQEFRTYREKDNLEGNPGETGRMALLHEYRGIDGSYVLSSAASITLQKTCSIRVPIEILETPTAPAEGEEQPQEGEEEAPAFCGFEEPVSDLEDKPLDAGSVHAQVVEGLAGRLTTIPQQTSTLAIAMQAKGMAYRIIDWQARGGFDSLVKQWKDGNKPAKIYGPNMARSDGPFVKSVSMWQCVPKAFCLNLDPYGAKKRYYFGRAVIQITEDGSIVLESATGDRVIVGGGNITLQAKHDVITQAGRNVATIAGRDSTIRADRHIDINANTGRLTMMSASQLTAVGGLDGYGGVHIESRGEHEATHTVGDLPALSGALVLKSTKLTRVLTGDFVVKARAKGWSAREGGGGNILLDANDEIMWRAERGANYGTFGREVYMKVNGSRIRIGENTVFEGRVNIQQLVYNTWRHSKDFVYVAEGVGAVLDKVLDTFQRWHLSAVSPGEGQRPKWLTSEQYNITGTDFFALPEPTWAAQAKSELTADSVVVQSVMKDNQVEGTNAWPGTAAWTGYGLAQVTYAQPDPTIIQPTGDNAEDAPEEPEPTVSFSMTTVGIDGNLLKGI